MRDKKKTSWLFSVFKLAADVEKEGKDSKGKAAKLDSRKAPAVQLAIVLVSTPILEQLRELTIETFLSKGTRQASEAEHLV